MPPPGSSPHTRGAPASREARGRALGDHPRIRGEHGKRDIRRDRWRVDHPRIRGEHITADAVWLVAVGIIPAYAGSTLGNHQIPARLKGSSPHTRGAPGRWQTSTSLRRDHPRIRGEHENVIRVERCVVGIIPAYAGSTASPSGGLQRVTGSSPHTRGALCRCLKTRCHCWDHPRIRGEHMGPIDFAWFYFRIIPAYAGSTVFFPSSEEMSGGSSPHTRGAPRLREALP